MALCVPYYQRIHSEDYPAVLAEVEQKRAEKAAAEAEENDRHVLQPQNTANENDALTPAEEEKPKSDTPPAVFNALGKLLNDNEVSAILTHTFGAERSDGGKTPTSRLLTMFRRLADEPGGRKALKRLARLVDEYGIPRIEGNPSTFGPHTLFPQLPKGWPVVKVMTHEFSAMTVAQLKAILDQGERFDELVAALADAPDDRARTKFCADWWHANVVHRPVAGVSDAPPLQSGLQLTPAAVELQAHMMEAVGDPYAGQEAADHYGPSEDRDIVVCGTVLYARGSADYATYRLLYATYEMWRHWDHHLALASHKPDVRARGYEIRRSCGWLKVINPVAGRFVWRIGDAMASAPERFAETSAATKRPNGA